MDSVDIYSWSDVLDEAGGAGAAGEAVAQPAPPLPAGGAPVTRWRTHRRRLARRTQLRPKPAH